ncbi:MAG: IS66 family insertion sequence element accessory protein TnpB [Rhodobacter sp.]|nr:IS66 family insertion sequence element accessory protein TnpB [Rhodobacter sp.]
MPITPPTGSILHAETQHDGVGMSLYVKRLEAGKFIWPTAPGGEAVAVSAAQLGYLLTGSIGAIPGGHSDPQRWDSRTETPVFVGILAAAW